MKKPQAPENEKERLENVHCYDILDTSQEKDFDDLTELAASICESPIALISIIDEKRQWFKSRFGLSATETARDVSFCGHAINQEDLFIIPDATKDERFFDNPLVTAAPSIRFYAGAPLISTDGHALGTLCVIDTKSRKMKKEHQKALRILSRHVMTQLELRRKAAEVKSLEKERNSAVKKLKEEHKQIERLVKERTEKYLKSEEQSKKLLEQNDRSRKSLLSILEDQKQVEQILRQYEKIINSTTDMMSFVDENYIYRAVNEAYLKAHAKNREEIIGHTISEILTNDVFEKKYKANFDKALKGNTIHYQSWFEYPGINKRFMDVTFHPYMENSSEVSGVVTVVHDITEQKIAEIELRRQASELTAINNLSRAISSNLSIKQTKKSALNGIVKIIQPDFTFLFLRNGDTLNLDQVLPLNKRKMLGDIPEHRVGECICGLSVNEKKSLFSKNIFNDTRCTFEECKRAGIISYAALPLFSSDAVIGVIGLASNSERDFEQQKEFLQTLASQVSVALENALLYDRAKKEIAERKQTEKALKNSSQHLAINLKYFEAMERISKVLSKRQNLEQMLRDTLYEINQIFKSDRAFLLNLTNSDGTKFKAQYHVTKPKFKVPPEMMEEIEANKNQLKIIKNVFKSSKPVFVNMTVPELKNEPGVKMLSIKSQLSVGIKNKIGFWWTLGLHQCSHIKVWSKQDRKLFADIADRIKESIDNLTLLKNLTESEERYRSLFNGVPVGLYRTDISGNILDVNQTMIEMMGFKDRESILKYNTNAGYVDSNDRKYWKEQMEKKGMLRDFETQWYSPDKSKIWVRESAKVIRDKKNKEIFYEGAVEDITERKKAQLAHHESEEKYKNLVENISDVHFITNEKGILTYISSPIESLTGFKPSEVIGNTFQKFIHKDDLPLITQQFQKVLKGILEESEYRIVTKSGKLCWVRSSSKPIMKNNHPSGLQGIITNINERKKAQSELERLSAAIEQQAEAVVITDDHGVILYVNPAFERISGYTREESVGQNPRILKSGEHDSEFYKSMWQTISKGKVWKGQFINLHKEGKKYIEEATISPVIDNSGKIVNYVGVKRDITREQELEEQFHQAQKMESVGRLAGGVAHDFNNMLSVILGYSELAMKKMNPSDKIYNDLMEIMNAGHRSADLTAQLLAFARKQTISPKLLDLNDTVSKMLKMLRRLIGEDIELVWKPGPSLWSIYIDPSQIDQLLANLCVNARDAIKGNGKVNIETENITLDEDYCKAYTYASPGNYVLLTVSDNGCGMDKNTLENIFEPFFTSKKQGEGTGLGLSTVYGIVKQNNGLINVYSEPGQGSIFKIYFQKYIGDSIVEEDKEILLPKGNGEHILIVEDEKSILDLTKSMLTNIGYTVIASISPKEAIRTIKKESNQIQLLITDVVMPEMNGRDLANQLKKINPKIKILYMSGYTSDIIANRGVIDEGVNFITKPFSLSTLAFKINDILKQ